MKVNTKELLVTLSKMLNLVDTSGTHWAHPNQNFHFGKKVLQTHTGSMRATTTVPFSLECSVEAKPLHSLIKNVTSEEVGLKVVGEDLLVKAGSVKAKLPTHEKNIIKDFSFKGDMGTVVCSYTDAGVLFNMIEGSKFFKYAVLKNGAGPTGGLRIDEDVIMSTDRRRIMIWLLDESIKGFTCTLSAKLVDVLQKFQKTVSRIDLTKSFVVKIQLDDTTYLETNTLQGKYPDLLQFAPGNEPGNIIHVRIDDSFSAALKQHSAFQRMTPVNDKEVTLNFTDNVCVMTSTTRNAGELETKITLTSDVEKNLVVMFHPAFLQDIVDVGDGFEYHLEEHVAVVNMGKLQYLLQVRQ